MQALASHPTAREPTRTDGEFDPLESAEGGFGAVLRPYRWLHLVYTAVVIVLVVTGLPIQFPDLRAELFGGYGRSLATIHEWAGVAMLVVPMTALFSGTARIVDTIRIRSYRREYFRFHAFNLWFTLSSGVFFLVTGFFLWFQARLPDAIVDVSMELHILFSYALYVLIPLHILTARQRIVELTLRWWRVGPTRPEEHGA